MSDDDYSDDPGYDEFMHRHAEMAAVMRDRMERWTRLVSIDGSTTIHCPITHISCAIRVRLGEVEGTHWEGVASAGDHVIIVHAASQSVAVARFDAGDEGEIEAENFIAEFLRVRGLDREVIN